MHAGPGAALPPLRQCGTCPTLPDHPGGGLCHARLESKQDMNAAFRPCLTLKSKHWNRDFGFEPILGQRREEGEGARLRRG
eukprot:896568-Pelagomonas_calceolata.AAC.1